MPRLCTTRPEAMKLLKHHRNAKPQARNACGGMIWVLWKENVYDTVHQWATYSLGRPDCWFVSLKRI